MMSSQIVALAMAIDGLHDPAVTIDKLFRFHFGDEVQVKPGVAAKALFQEAAFSRRHN